MVVAVLALAAGLGACGPTTARSGAASHGVSRSTGHVDLASRHRPPSKVLLVVEENHSEATARHQMPYLRRLGERYGRTTHYRAVGHPSLPNYLALTGGSTFGVRDDNGPAAHRIPGPSVFDQALARHRTAKTYAESMPGHCVLAPSGLYAVKHNPWAYFSGSRSRANCRRYDVPAGSTTSGALHHDIVRGRLPAVGLLVPNLCDDAHNCSLGVADRWLHRWMAEVQRGPDWRSGRLVVVVTFDENDGTTPNTVLTTVLGRRTHQVVSAAPYTHYSWTRFADQLVGAAPLRHARTAHSLGPAFHL